MKKGQGNSILTVLSQKAKLEEGPEAVRNILREIFRSRKISTKNLASLTQLPIPVTAAVISELEKAGLVTRKMGTLLTARGQDYVTKNLGFSYPNRLTCTTCEGKNIQITDQFKPLLEKLKDLLDRRPKPLPWLDQTHGTPETALLRALYMLERGDLEGRRIIFLGDDDFTSIAVALLDVAVEVTVIDVDQRLLKAIKSVSGKENLAITCMNFDLRKNLPRQMRGKFDVVFTDPPYTTPGLTLFASRAITVLKPEKGGTIYLAYAHQPPNRALIMNKILANMGLAIMEQIPKFNIYKGAEMFANTTFIVRLQTTEKSRPLIASNYEGKIYTGEINLTRRKYQCRCGQEITVGALEMIRTIQELKVQGCPKCGKTKGFRIIEKQKVKETLAEELILRDFEWTDFSSILEFEREIARISFPEAPILDKEYHREKLQRALKQDSSHLVVAVLGKEIVGWLWLRMEKDRSTGERFGYIKTIIVKPEHRHQGFGRKLLEFADRFFQEKHINRIDLIAGAANHEALMFFEEMGFETQHSTMRKRISRKEVKS